MSSRDNPDLLRGHVICCCPHVNLLIYIETRDDREHEGEEEHGMQVLARLPARLKVLYFGSGRVALVHGVDASFVEFTEYHPIVEVPTEFQWGAIDPWKGQVGTHKCVIARVKGGYQKFF